MKVGYFAVVLLACFLQACSSFGGKDSTEMDGFVTGLMDRMTVREKLSVMLWNVCMRQEPERPITCLYL